MILLFGEQKTRTASTHKNNNVKNNPVENAGILAMSLSDAKSMLTMGEFDTYVSSNPTMIDYSNFAGSESFDASSVGFMSEFSAAVACLGGDCGGFSDCGFSSCSSGSSCGSFSSCC